MNQRTSDKLLGAGLGCGGCVLLFFVIGIFFMLLAHRVKQYASDRTPTSQQP